MAVRDNSGALGIGVLGASLLGWSTAWAQFRPALPASSSLLGAQALGQGLLGGYGYGTLPADNAVTTDSAKAGVSLPRPVGDSALATDSWRPSAQPAHATDSALSSDVAHPSAQPAHAVDSSLSSDAATGGLRAPRPTADNALAADAASAGVVLARPSADSSLAADSARANATTARTASDAALSADSGIVHPIRQRQVFDAALAIDATTVSNQHFNLAALDTAAATDNAFTGFPHVVSASAADLARAEDSGAGGSPRAFDVASTNDSAITGVPKQFTFDSALAHDVAHGSTPHASGRGSDRALSLDQAAGIAHHVIPPSTPAGETPLFLTNIATGPTSRAPLTIESIRDRFEKLDRQLAKLEQNRYSVGPSANQESVPMHALANAAPMGAVDDQGRMVFDEASGQFHPGGPALAIGVPPAGAAPAGPPYGFVSEVQVGSFTGVISGGKLSVPFQDDHGNPIPFASAVLSITICVGDTERNR